ncbi:heptaprenyl diphosphate synthase component 1 [Alkalihalobacterium chitinilyticum]|uniref:Heptaprenyl diphosphate synthase component 1 n=1 Tax=Alkalihalobacterium chitinilyticum TaxID=2980103 RepID=A0ABT5V9C4_9BACI|nr:heptaprenyl diphosphate synthase component 1 [Alkalihalobacterium chitinilyticum]MDE5411932.1 heptaprenyl diphosphate synthase component 1 [Alkalihalobacterium chitinilyticum]
MNDFNEMVNECKDKFFSLTEHTFLQKYIQKPDIDEDKVRFIYAMLSEQLPEIDINNIALASILVDAALNTHEKVSLNKINSDYVKKNRQLTVLAGDYYSSLYYYLLAHSGQMSMIRLFSISIQEINEHKMNIYQNENLTFEATHRDICSIESAILQNMADHFQLPNWKLAISEFFFLKRLIFERSQWLEGRKLPIVRALIHDHKQSKPEPYNPTHVEVLQLINEKISEGKEQVEKLLEDPLFQQDVIMKQMERLFSPLNYS